MIPGISDIMLSGGQGGMTISPSSSASSGYTRNTLNFGNSTSTIAGGNASAATGVPVAQLLIAGAVIVAAAYFVGRA